MAIPITPTPILEGKEAIAFDKKVKREESIKVPLVPTPELEHLRQIILANAGSREK